MLVFITASRLRGADAVYKAIVHSAVLRHAVASGRDWSINGVGGRSALLGNMVLLKTGWHNIGAESPENCIVLCF